MSLEADEAEDARAPRPLVTLALIGVIALVFAAEVIWPAVAGPDRFDPTVQTLVAYGGTSGSLVLERGQWFRVLTAAFLHAGPMHLALNSLGLLVAGGTLESVIGRAWLAALFLIGAAGGGIASVHWNGAGIVGVGASGAIMGLFGFLAVIALRFPRGPARRAFLANALGALVPSLAPALLPLFGSGGLQIDYASHAGGALAGAVAGLGFLLFWPRHAAQPGGTGLALALVLAGGLVLGFGMRQLTGDFDEVAFQGRLIPDSALPKTDAEARARGEGLIARFPEDPRGHFYLALRHIRDRNTIAAEASARRAVTQAERYPDAFVPAFRARLRATHALLLNDLDRKAEARTVAAPACQIAEIDDLAAALRHSGLCR